MSARRGVKPVAERPAGAIPTVSLFCGSGGLDLGFARAGFTPILAIDHEEAACMTFQVNHPSSRVIKRDLSRIPPGYVAERLQELPASLTPMGIVGGPPCQAFSRSNVHKRLRDPRRVLPRTYARILAELRQQSDIGFFVFENVAGLRDKDHKRVFRELEGHLRAAGFIIFVGELDAKDFGVPQARRRVFIVGFNNERFPNPEFAFPVGRFTEHKTVKDAIWGLPEPTFFERNLVSSKLPFHPNHWCMQPVSAKFTNGKLKEGVIKGRPFRVLSWNRPSWTVAYGHREVHVHPSGKRRLSVYEAMLLQGFPEKYQLLGNLSEQIRMVSDAVPPALGEALGKAVRKVIDDGKNINTKPK